MSSTSSATPGLRALHALVFLGLCAISLAATGPEWEQLKRSQQGPYHFGDPPRLLALFSSGLCAMAAAALLALLLRRRPVKRGVSLAILLGFMGSLASLSSQVDSSRSWAAADLAILSTGRALHARMVQVLQETGRVPTDPTRWQAALAEVSPSPSPARDSWFRALPYRLVWSSSMEGRTRPATPGEFHVSVHDAGKSFLILPIGFDRHGNVAPLADEEGAPVELRGAFNPELKAAAGEGWAGSK